MRLKICLAVACAAGSAHVHADDWSANVGLKFSETKSTLDSNPSDGRSTYLNASLTRRLDAKTQLGGSISLGESKTNADLNRGRFSNDATSIAVFGVREIGSLRFVDLSLGYGKVMLDGDYRNGGAPVDFDTDTNFWTLGAGLTQAFLLSPTLSATLSGRLSHSRSNSDAYHDSTPTRHGSDSSARTQASFGGGLNWRLGAWSPSAGLTYSRANQNLTRDVDDKDYFTVNLGVAYALTPKTRLNFGYTGIAGKSQSRENSLLTSISTSF